MNERDELRLRHMRDAALAARQFVAGLSEADLEQDLMRSYAVQHALQIIGEAASQVTPETRLQFPQIDWKNIIGMRQWLVHVYDRVKIEAVWSTVSNDLPILIDQLDNILGPLDSRSSGSR
jgi:uncharacterized protein with HEPN domain